MVEASEKKFEFAFSEDKISDAEKDEFLASFEAQIAQSDELRGALLECASKTNEEEAARRLEMLKLDDGQQPLEEGKTMALDLTKFSSKKLLDQLLAFATYLKSQDAMSALKILNAASSYREYTTFKTLATELLETHPEFLQSIKDLSEQAVKKFKTLVLVDLGGTILYRTDKRDCGNHCDFRFKKYQYFWRPGYADMFLRLEAHPCVMICLYTSMMRKTITPVMHELMHDADRKLDAILGKIGSFDRDYCKEMRGLKYYDAIKEENYDTYRDLQSIFDDPICQQNGYKEENTILIDSESRKVQLWLDNSVISEPYTREDVNLISHPDASQSQGEVEVRNAEWQREYMAELTQFIVDVVENQSSGVPAYLKEHRPRKYAPQVLLPELSPEEFSKARKYQLLKEKPAEEGKESEAKGQCAAQEKIQPAQEAKLEEVKV